MRLALADIGAHRVINEIGVSSLGVTMPGLRPGQNYGAVGTVINPDFGGFSDYAFQNGSGLLGQAVHHVLERGIYRDASPSRIGGYVFRKQHPEKHLELPSSTKSWMKGFNEKRRDFETRALDGTLITNLSHRSYQHPETRLIPLHIVMAAVEYTGHNDDPVSAVQWMHAFALGYMIAESVVVTITPTDKIPEDRVQKLDRLVQGAFMFTGIEDRRHWESTFDTEQSDGRVAVVGRLRHGAFAGEFPVQDRGRFSGMLDVVETLGHIVTKTDVQGMLSSHPEYGWSGKDRVPKLKIPDELMPLLSHFLIKV